MTMGVVLTGCCQLLPAPSQAHSQGAVMQGLCQFRGTLAKVYASVQVTVNRIVKVTGIRLAHLARFGLNRNVCLQAGWANGGPGSKVPPGSPTREAAAGTGHASDPAKHQKGHNIQHAPGQEAQVWWSCWCRGCPGGGCL